MRQIKDVIELDLGQMQVQKATLAGIISTESNNTNKISGRSLIYNRKRVGPRMAHGGKPTLTGYCCEDFPICNHSRLSFTEK